jgi:nitrite reductase/ring-hydroxylating ferredoxin subunit
LPWFPFETLGFTALMILMAMAATSHDLWLSFLGPRAWKALHRLVYLAYFLLVGHVALGILQLEHSPWLAIPMFLGSASLCLLHILAARRDMAADHHSLQKDDGRWVSVGRSDEFPEGRAKVVSLAGERIAIFNDKGALSAVHNVCKHQMGPLGEGRIVDGCITCPWHGFQYQPGNGCAPAPFHEKIHTYRLKRDGDMIFLNPAALPEGTAVDPVRIDRKGEEDPLARGFFIGWRAGFPTSLIRTPRLAAIAFALLAMMFAVLFVRQQRKLTPFRMDYDHVKVIEGWLTASPVPMVRIPVGTDEQGVPRYKDILLSDAGKFGAARTVEQVLKTASMKYVRLNGYISQRIAHCGADSVDCERPCRQCLTGTDDYPVMEIGDGAADAFRELPATTAFRESAKSMETDTIIHGQIVDPKCFFGAMNPGQGKTHLSCAARCLSGGIMPVLRWTAPDGVHYAILMGPRGESFHREASSFTAIPVSVKGRLQRLDNWELVHVDALEKQ